jgi:hypothetical protein
MCYRDGVSTRHGCAETLRRLCDYLHVGNRGIEKDCIMRSRRLGRRLPAVAGGAAIIAMVGLTAACGGNAPQGPSSTTTTTTTTTTVSPTEKVINPTGGNQFTPTHVITPAPPTGGGPGGH